MPIALTAEQQDLAASVREFCRREVGTKEQRDKLTDFGPNSHSLELNRKVAELGWAAIDVPEEYAAPVAVTSTSASC